MGNEHFFFPNGWKKYRIGDFAEIVSGATPKTKVKKYWGGNILWATPKDLGQLNSIEISDTERKITKVGYESCSTKLLPPGSVLLSSRAPIGHLAINTKPMCTNQGFKSLIPQDDSGTGDLGYDITSLIWQRESAVTSGKYGKA